MPYPTKTNYSEHFTRRELDCHCGCDTPLSIEKELVKTAEELEKLRAILAMPLHINSGYRCPTYNKRIGGAPRSTHMAGLAADVSAKCSPSYVALSAEKVLAYHNGGIGRYAGFTHVDRRGYEARWEG